MIYSASATLKSKDSYQTRKLLAQNGFTIYLVNGVDPKKMEPFIEDYSNEEEKIIFLDENVFFFCVYNADKPLNNLVRDELDYGASIISASTTRDNR